MLRSEQRLTEASGFWQVAPFVHQVWMWQESHAVSLVRRLRNLWVALVNRGSRPEMLSVLYGYTHNVGWGTGDGTSVAVTSVQSLAL
jgi:hypothetical protein